MQPDIASPGDRPPAEAKGKSKRLAPVPTSFLTTVVSGDADTYVPTMYVGSSTRMLRVRDKRVHVRLKDKRTLCTGGGSGVQVLRSAGLLQSQRRAPRMEGKVTSDEVLKQNGELPRDARVMAQLLKSMGVEEYQPRVLNQLLEFMYRYVSEILQDGLMYAEHAGRQELSVDDVQLAVQARVNSSFTQPPPRELLLELAKEKNSNPLPPYPARLGVLLPPEEHCLIQPTYQIEPKPAPKRTSQPHSHTEDSLTR